MTFISDLKRKIAEARHPAGLSVNRELILLYWNIGRDILARQDREELGAKIINRLAADLGRAFPEMTGLSARNLTNRLLHFILAWLRELLGLFLELLGRGLASPAQLNPAS
ncbi:MULTISPECIES: DUF1016 N-terminal domain-containing protein [Bradyrhizobium]|uniref:DUF1016 N-terminal domain-containing protein n=1 Tax=Bradyrhizobium TaxID=374 RepID=UPI001F203C3B|nr:MULTISPECIES: DUF1016 N-terminal domain-containing protein [Bradyrhizobium]